jgi:translation initiation factor 2 alpha subunit (eIF-2alpha)
MIHNLDADIKEKEIVKLAGEEIDISFIPCGVSIPLLSKYDKWVSESKKEGVEKIKNNVEIAQDNFKMQAEILSMFTSYTNPKLDYEWLLHNADLYQISSFMQLLIKSITSYIKKSQKKNQVKPQSGKE